MWENYNKKGRGGGKRKYDGAEVFKAVVIKVWRHVVVVIRGKVAMVRGYGGVMMREDSEAVRER